MTVGEVGIGWAGMVLPVLILAAIALFLPVFQLRNRRENYQSLLIVFGLSCFQLAVLAFLYFCAEYWRRGVPVDALLDTAGVMHIGRLAALSALFWVPIVITVLISQPSKWRPDL